MTKVSDSVTVYRIACLKGNVLLSIGHRDVCSDAEKTAKMSTTK